MKTAIIVLSVGVDDLSDEERRNLASDLEVPVEALETLDHIDIKDVAKDVARSVEDAGLRDVDAELKGFEILAAQWGADVFGPADIRVVTPL